MKNVIVKTTEPSVLLLQIRMINLILKGFIMKLLKWMFLSMVLSSSSIALSDSFDPILEEYEMQNDVTEMTDEILSDYFRCDLVVIIIDFSQNYRRSRHTFTGQGRSWGDSRNDAFQRYGQWIQRGNFWRSSFNHQFYFNNCFG